MIIVEYTPIGIPISDWECKKFAQRLLNSLKLGNSNSHYQVSTENVLGEIRALIAEDIIEHNKICFKFNNQLININEYGVCSDWPKGFCDTGFLSTERCLRAATNKRIKQDEQRHNSRSSQKS